MRARAVSAVRRGGCALAYGDDALRRACERCFDNIVQKRMYLTGGVGSSHIGETFTIDYDLPNRTAYTETCAAISLAMFANRMLMFGVSMDGQAFFYENPLEIDPDFNYVNVSSLEKERFPITQRVAVFTCSCCPSNLLRFVASIAGYLYTADEDTVYVHQYMNSQTSAGDIEIAQETAYPEDPPIRKTGAFESSAMREKSASRCAFPAGAGAFASTRRMKSGMAMRISSCTEERSSSSTCRCG